MSYVLPALLITAGWLLIQNLAYATPLERSTCLRSWNDQDRFKRLGAPDLIAKSPDTIMKNLQAEQLKLIRAYIANTENLKFRCPQFTPPPRLNPKR